MLGQIAVIVSVTFLVMVTPGPDMVLVLRNTVLAGRRAGFRTALGILMGNLVHITYWLLGIGWLISRSIVAFNGLRFAAAGYLIYLGIASFRSRRSVPGATASPRWRLQNWFAQGLINNVLNPKGTLFYLGVFTVVIAPGTSASAMVVLVASMLLVSAAFWLLFVCTLDRPAVRTLFERSGTLVDRLCGGLLILLGVRVAVAK